MSTAGEQKQSEQKQDELKQGELKPLEAPYFSHFNQLIGELQQRPHLMLELESESFGQFACTQCGECCRLAWRIDINQAYYNQWYEHFDQHPSGRFSQPFERLEKPTPKLYAAIQRQPGSNACIFLEADNSCFIHNNYGSEALSDICRDYPRVGKRLGQQIATRQLMHSCQVVPELIQAYPGLMYRLKDSTQSLSALPSYSSQSHPGRFVTYLWLGMALDLIEAPQPETTLSRWRLMLPMLEWMDGIGMQQLSIRQITLIYQDLMSRAAFAGLEAPDPNQQFKALKWAMYFLKSHPGCSVWLNQLLLEQNWPELTQSERQLLDHYLGLYLRSRLLAMPYMDLFLGSLSLWQQCLLLGIQMLVLQYLALYYSQQEGSRLQPHHLQRAINSVGFHFEQRPDLSTEYQFKDLEPEQCYSALEVLHSVDFAAPLAWTFVRQTG